MGYLHIDNLYKNQNVLKFREVYAMEKIHGTSAHVKWEDGKLSFFSGGEKHAKFVSLFDQDALAAAFAERHGESIVVYGEAYGGKQQGMSATYGPDLKFVAFDVKRDGEWVGVELAERIVIGLGIEFVSYKLISSDIESVDRARDADSVQAKRNGMGDGKKAEGTVLRPSLNVQFPEGKRPIAKHKRDDFSETRSPRKVGVAPEVLSAAQAIADEWVTEMRLTHVLQKLPHAVGIEHTKDVIGAMVEDVIREGEGEIVDSRPARKAIMRAAAIMYKDRIVSVFREANQ